MLMSDPFDFASNSARRSSIRLSNCSFRIAAGKKATMSGPAMRFNAAAFWRMDWRRLSSEVTADDDLQIVLQELPGNVELRSIEWRQVFAKGDGCLGEVVVSKHREIVRCS